MGDIILFFTLGIIFFVIVIVLFLISIFNRSHTNENEKIYREIQEIKKNQEFLNNEIKKNKNL